MRDDKPAETDATGAKHNKVLRAVSYAKPGPARRLALRLSYWRERAGAGLALLLREEEDRGGAFLWAPVFFGMGILLYFALPREPLVFAFPAAATIAAITALRSLRTGLTYRISMVVLLVAGGVVTAQTHVQWKATPMLSTGTVADIDALIVRIEERANGSARYTLAIDNGPASLTGRGIDRLPNRIRLTARKAMLDAEIGDRLTGTARVGPPPAPVMPGGYDFAFHAWFDGLGGSGFFLGAPRLVAGSAAGWSIESIRHGIAGTIRTALPGEAGGIAVALIVGDRSGIPEEVSEALRRSGLAHILAISGLHMTLIAGTVLVGARVFFAAIPGLALQYPVKKWAAGAALVAATLYLSISGGGVSARRAYIMIAIMLLAVLADRRALTMRNVAIAAFAVLLLSPQAILSPGFQMSFAAVAALIAMFEIARERRSAACFDDGRSAAALASRNRTQHVGTSGDVDHRGFGDRHIRRIPLLPGRSARPARQPAGNAGRVVRRDAHGAHLDACHALRVGVRPAAGDGLGQLGSRGGCTTNFGTGAGWYRGPRRTGNLGTCDNSVVGRNTLAHAPANDGDRPSCAGCNCADSRQLPGRTHFVDRTTDRYRYRQRYRGSGQTKSGTVCDGHLEGSLRRRGRTRGSLSLRQQRLRSDDRGQDRSRRGTR